jgi:hypothetical protein
VYLIAAPRLTPYADSKLLVLASAPVVFAAAVGGWRLIAWRWWLGLPLAAAISLGVLLSDARTYNGVRLAPTDRLEALQDAADHAAALRPNALWMENEWEEYAKYFMRSIRVNPAAEDPGVKPVLLRMPVSRFGQYFDLDAQRIGYVTSFPGIIKRRSPDASRPPDAYAKVYENDYYEVWRRRPGVRVIEHLPLQRRFDATTRPSCGAVLRMASRARRGQRMVAAGRPDVPLFDTARHPKRGWMINGDPPETVTPLVPGRTSGWVRTGGGRFRVWINGSFGRPVSAYVDGRRVGAAEDVNTPRQWLDVGTVILSRGSHRVGVRRPTGSLAPGDSYRGEIGPVALEPVSPIELVVVDPAAARDLCGREWDWIERVGRRSGR